MLNECKVIGIMNLKGGCGKTTTAFNLADNLTRRDFNVLLVDTDSQANLTRNCGIEKSTKLENTVATSMYAVMSGEEMDPAKAGIISVKEGLDIFPANSTMAQAKIMLSRAMAREQVLKKVLEPIKPAYDLEDVEKIIETENRTNVYPMSWYSSLLWEYIKANALSRWKKRT